MSFTTSMQEYYGAQKDNFINQLTDAKKLFTKLNEFVTLSKIPDEPKELTRYGPIRNDVDFFLPAKGQHIFYYLANELLASGIRPRDITAWRKLKPPLQPGEQPNQALPAETMMIEEAPAGIFERLSTSVKKLGTGVLDFLSGPDLSGLMQAPLEPEDPYNHLVKTYERGCTLVEHFHKGMAQGELGEVRQAIARYVTGLLRDLRTYVNDRVMETGGQVTTVASA
ncbi:MAG: hypothetical protein ABSF09_07920 [Candidatus Bathyarchaeia archaeon]|jgi:hypothetical protein